MKKSYANQSPKKQQKTLRIISIILAILSIFIFFVMSSGSDDEYKIINAHDYEGITSLDDSLAIGTDIVEFNELVIVDLYATYGSVNDENDVDTAYYLAVFYNKDTPYYASICCDVGSEIYETLQAYINDESQQIGDMNVPACAIHHSSSDDGARFYLEGIDFYNESLGMDIADSGLELEYVFATADGLEDYKNAKKNEGSAVAICSMIMFLAAVCGIFVTSFKLKKIKKEEAENQPLINDDVYYKEENPDEN